MKNRLLNTLIPVFLALVLILPAAGAFAEEHGVLLYQSSFGSGMDGWYARGAERSFVTESETLRTEGRTQDWNSPGRDFALTPGVPYHMTVEIRQDDKAKADFMISIAHSRNGEETYENLGSGTVPKGEWTTVEGSWTAGQFDTYVLYVETIDGTAPELSFEIRNFRLYSDSNPAAEFMEKWESTYAKRYEKSLANLKAAVIPENMRNLSLDGSSWLTMAEVPTLASIKEFTLEDNLLTVTLDRKVNYAYIREAKKNWDVVGESKSQPGPTLSLQLKKPKGNDVTLFVSEYIKTSRGTNEYLQTYTLKPSKPELKLSEISSSTALKAADYPPYGKLNTRSAIAFWDLHGNGTAKRLQMNFDTAAFKLDISASFNTRGMLDSVYFSRSNTGSNAVFSSVMLDSKGQVESVHLNFESLMEISFWHAIESYYDFIGAGRYDYSAVREKGVHVWQASVSLKEDDFTGIAFATREDLFTRQEDGSLLFNEDVKDIDGNPFPWPEIVPLLDPQLFSIPQIQ